MAFEVTKNTIIGDIMEYDESVSPYFTEKRMHCLYCPSARGETLEDACDVHGVNADDMVKKINAHLSK